MKMKNTAIVLIIASLTGCASPGGASFTPVVDKPNENYSRDLSECQAHANKVMSAGESAAAGAAAGAVFGLLMNAAMGGGMRNESAAMGALGGAVGGASSGIENQQSIIRKCLQSRGHSILN